MQISKSKPKKSQSCVPLRNPRFSKDLPVILLSKRYDGQDQGLTSQEHRHLLKILFAHELQTVNVRSFFKLFFVLQRTHRVPN
jgi:hypothetical protein